MTKATSSTRRRRAFSLKRHGAALALAGGLGAATPALADGGDSPYRFGLMLDAGAPHGIGVSAVLKPIHWLRLQAGPTTNTLSFGLRGGLSILPMQTFLAPSFNVEAGHYFGSDYNEVVDWLGATPSSRSAAIRDVTYNYVTGTVGLEVGAASRFNFFLHVGLSYVRAGVDDASALLQDVTEDPDVTARNLSVRATMPSVKLGFILYFF